MMAKTETKQPSGRRSAARLAAVQALYQLELAAAPVEAVIDEYRSHRLGKEIEGDIYRAADAEWFADVVRGASARRAELDPLIEKAMQRELKRLEALLRAALRAAAYELLARADVPVRVVIDEYVDIAHAFFSGAEPALVNGILDRLAHDLRPAEFAG